MTNIFNSPNILWGMLLAKDRGKTEQIRAAMQASLMPINNAIGTLLIKQGIDDVVKLENEKNEVESKLNIVTKDINGIINALNELSAEEQTSFIKLFDEEVINTLKKYGFKLKHSEKVVKAKL